MIGPWIAPTVVLIAGFILRIISGRADRTESLTLIQAASSIGGIVATAVGFMLPTLYFLDRTQFNAFFSGPLRFSITLGSICLIACLVGVYFANAFKKRFLAELPFPVSNMIHKTIISQTQTSQAKKLVLGFSLNSLLCLFRDGFTLGMVHIPKIIPVKTFLNLITLSPMLWAIGFIAGTSFALPLFIGMVSKYVILTPLNLHSQYLPFALFPVLDKQAFAMAFCSGLILAEFLPGLIKYPSLLFGEAKKFSIRSYISHFGSIQAIPAIVLSSLLFLYFKFPPLSLLVIIPLSAIAAYHISFIGGKIGLAQIGRFTTLVMIPTMLLFSLTALQITILCVFVGVCITTTTDLLFSCKVGELSNVSEKKLFFYQMLGIVVTALSIGLFMWLICTHLQLGSVDLIAQRARSRALLIQSLSFDWIVLICGLLFGLLLRKLKISPQMVFGGIIMPNKLTIGLLIGALGTLLVKDKKEHFPFFSGIFAAESLWMIIQILTKIVH